MLFPFLPFMVQDFFPELNREELGPLPFILSYKPDILALDCPRKLGLFYLPIQAVKLATWQAPISLETSLEVSSGDGCRTTGEGDRCCRLEFVDPFFPCCCLDSGQL